MLKVLVKLIFQIATICVLIGGLALASFAVSYSKTHVIQIDRYDAWKMSLVPLVSRYHALTVICIKYLVLTPLMITLCVHGLRLVSFTYQSLESRPTTINEPLVVRAFMFYVCNLSYLINGLKHIGFSQIPMYMSKVKVVVQGLVTPGPGTMDVVRYVLSRVCNDQFCGSTTLEAIQHHVNELRSYSNENIDLKWYGTYDTYLVAIMNETSSRIVDDSFKPVMDVYLSYYTNCNFMTTIILRVGTAFVTQMVYMCVNAALVKLDSIITADRVACERTPLLMLLDRYGFLILRYVTNLALMHMDVVTMLSNALYMRTIELNANTFIHVRLVYVWALVSSILTIRSMVSLIYNKPSSSIVTLRLNWSSLMRVYTYLRTPTSRPIVRYVYYLWYVLTVLVRLTGLVLLIGEPF